jgi:hypothetical protein
VQIKFEKERIQEIKEGRALAVVVDGGVSRLERLLGKSIFFRFGRFPTDEEVRRLNVLLEKDGDEYRIIPAGHHSRDCVPATLGALFYGKGYRSDGAIIKLTERLIIPPTNLHIIPELLVPQTKEIYLRGKH